MKTLALSGLLAGLLCGSPMVHAAVITWQNATAQTGAASDVVTVGTFFDSFASAPVDRVVNGVTFNGWVSTISDVASYANGSQISIVNPGNAAYHTSSIAPLPGAWDAGYQTLVHSNYGDADGGGGLVGEIQIDGLTVGAEYLVQIFMPFWDANWRTRFYDGTSYSDYLDAAVNGGVAVPDYLIGTFIADATTQSIWYEGQSSLATIFAGMQVRELTAAAPVPAPASLLLLGIGLVGLARGRRPASR